MSELEQTSAGEPNNLDDYILLRRLVEGVFNNLSLDALMDDIEAVLGAPALIVDMGFQVVAMSRSLKDGSRHRLYDSSGFLEQNFVKRLCTHYVFTKISEREYSSAVISLGGDNERVLVASVRVSGAEVLMLIVVWDARPAEQEEFQRLKKICQVLAVEFQKENSLNRYRLTVPNHLISSLLGGKAVDRKELVEKMSNLDWTSAKEFQLMIIADKGGHELAVRAPSVFSALKLFIPIERCLMHEANIVAFLTPNTAESLRLSWEAKFRRFLDNNGLRSAVGRPYADLLDSRYHYLLTKNTLEAAKRFNLTLAVFQNVQHYVIAGLIDHKFCINEFLHPGVLELLAYDSNNHTEFISTLKAYVYYKDNLEIVTKKLHIHRSTLFYRIKKIRELTGINTDLTNELSSLYCSFKMIEVFGKDEVLSAMSGKPPKA